MPIETTSGYLVVIGASAGGVQALLQLAEALPPGFPAPVCIVQHVGANPSLLPELLANRGPHPAVHARDRQLLTPGVLHVAPPDHHMLVEGRYLRLTRGPRENHTRPAIDPLFRSAALAWGPRAIGVVLSGYMDDGTAGLVAIKDRDGIAVVQDPATAEEPSMPRSALDALDVDYSVPLAELGPLLARLVHQEPAPEPGPAADALVREVGINRGEDLLDNVQAIAQPAGLACPDCGGGLFEVRDARQLRFRCHTGHAFSAQALERAQAEAGEDAMRGGVRALQEREILLRRMAAVSEATGDAGQAEAARRHADRLHAQVRELAMLAAAVSGEEP
ncbi:MAG TPA: chemotaxis protein CheB [Ramlibacter sp.]|uniref:chemotaxis protein CheB n=1 Tax=Ramlibacter sp. TaxID=1917967 RepID=UPI002D809B74|nr:chemotaxis protein CheB [Ramlibacter sp.]HET8748175.1 chemotaxis protein CheB [Ramlibacter sp.]